MRSGGWASSTSSPWREAARPRQRPRRRRSGRRKAYGSYEALLDDPDVQVVHNATPNYLHYPVNAAAIAKGKHVVSDKPLAMTAAEAKKLLDAGEQGRHRPRGDVQLSRQPAGPAGAARDRARRHRQAAISSSASTCRTGCSRTPTTRGASSPTRAARRRRSATSARTGAISRSTSAACGSPKCSATSRPSSPSARSRAARARRSQRRRRRAGRSRRHQGRGPRVGAAAVRQRREGRVLGRPGLRRPQERPDPRDLRLEGSLRWRQEHQNELWLGHRDKANEILQKDPSLMDAEVRGYAHLPGGHQEVLDRRVLQPDARHLRIHRRGEEAQRSASSGFRDVRRWLPRQLHRRGDSREREEGQRVDEGELLTWRQGVRSEVHEGGVLTAALQELTPREVRDPDPDRAIEEWVEFARELGADYIQLSAALHPTETDVPPEAMLDPVANTLDLRKPFDKARAARVKRVLRRPARSGSRTSAISTTCCTTTRPCARRSTTSCCATFDAAVLLGVDAVCGFVGRNHQHSMDENLIPRGRRPVDERHAVRRLRVAGTVAREQPGRRQRADDLRERPHDRGRPGRRHRRLYVRPRRGPGAERGALGRAEGVRADRHRQHERVPRRSRSRMAAASR